MEVTDISFPSYGFYSVQDESYRKQSQSGRQKRGRKQDTALMKYRYSDETEKGSPSVHDYSHEDKNYFRRPSVPSDHVQEDTVVAPVSRILGRESVHGHSSDAEIVSDLAKELDYSGTSPGLRTISMAPLSDKWCTDLNTENHRGEESRPMKIDAPPDSIGITLDDEQNAKEGYHPEPKVNDEDIKQPPPYAVAVKSSKRVPPVFRGSLGNTMEREVEEELTRSEEYGAYFEGPENPWQETYRGSSRHPEKFASNSENYSTAPMPKCRSNTFISKGVEPRRPSNGIIITGDRERRESSPERHIRFEFDSNGNQHEDREDCIEVRDYNRGSELRQNIKTMDQRKDEWEGWDVNYDDVCESRPSHDNRQAINNTHDVSHLTDDVFGYADNLREANISRDEFSNTYPELEYPVMSPVIDDVVANGGSFLNASEGTAEFSNAYPGFENIAYVYDEGDPNYTSTNHQASGRTRPTLSEHEHNQEWNRNLPYDSSQSSTLDSVFTERSWSSERGRPRVFREKRRVYPKPKDPIGDIGDGLKTSSVVEQARRGYAYDSIGSTTGKHGAGKQFQRGLKRRKDHGRHVRQKNADEDLRRSLIRKELELFMKRVLEEKNMNESTFRLRNIENMPTYSRKSKEASRMEGTSSQSSRVKGNSERPPKILRSRESKPSISRQLHRQTNLPHTPTKFQSEIYNGETNDPPVPYRHHAIRRKNERLYSYPKRDHPVSRRHHTSERKNDRPYSYPNDLNKTPNHMLSDENNNSNMYAPQTVRHHPTPRDRSSRSERRSSQHRTNQPREVRGHVHSPSYVANHDGERGRKPGLSSNRDSSTIIPNKNASSVEPIHAHTAAGSLQEEPTTKREEGKRPKSKGIDGDKEQGQDHSFRNWRFFSTMAAIWFFPIGIWALRKSFQVDSRVQAKDIPGAKRAAKSARNHSIAAFVVLGFIVIILLARLIEITVDPRKDFIQYYKIVPEEET